MSATQSLESLVSGGRKPVDVAGIEAELAATWRAAARPEKGGANEAVVRACLWNVVVHAMDGPDAERAQEELAQLSLTLPSRAILVRTDALAREAGIDAWIAANCRRTEDGRRYVCCEEIIVAARGRTMSELPALVRALLAPDVPSALVWMEDPSIAGRHFPAWCEAVDRIVFDSARFSSTAEFSFLLLALAGMRRRPCLGDLNWRRLRPWRVLLARLYDQAELRQGLLGVHRIVFAGPPATAPSAAALLSGWFGARLGWSAGRQSLRTPEGREVGIAVEDSSGEAPSDGLECVRFESPEHTLELVHRGERLDMRDHNVDSLPEAMQYPAPARTSLALLAEELEDYGGDPKLLEAAGLAASLLEPATALR